MAGKTAKSLKNGVAILDEWQADQHVYLVGDLGVSEGQMGELEEWMDANASNWTVLLMESSEGEEYTDVRGRKYHGVDAVEHAMGKGLPAATGFGSLKDPSTGRSNGAFFILSLKERNIFYYGSEAYRLNGLGKERWKGNLDRAAISAMRSGGRVIEAARGTIVLIDGEYRKAEARKKEEAARVQRDAGRRMEALEGKLSEAGKSYDILLKGMNDGASGSLALSPFGEWEQDFESLKGHRRAGHFNLLYEDAQELEQKVREWERSVRMYEYDGGRLRQLRREVDSLDANATELGQLFGLLVGAMDEAESKYRNGDPGYRTSLDQVQTRIEGYRRQIERLASRKRMVVLGSVGVVGVFGLFCFIGNRRRRRIKGQAENLLEKRRAEMKDISNELFAAMDRAAIVVGPIDELESRGYQGETLRLSKEALERIDEAFVLSSNVQKILEEADQLVHPASPLSRSRNLVSGGRYEDAVDLLDDEMRVTDKDVPEICERARPGKESEAVFSMPLDEWTGRTTDALARAEECLDEVDRAWTTIVDRRSSLSRRIEELGHRPVFDDCWLACEALDEFWIPAMREIHAKAVEIGKSDPVSALQGPIVEGERMVEEAGRLSNIVITFRKKAWSGIVDGEAALDARGRATIWVDQSLSSLGARCDEVAREGVKMPVNELIKEVEFRFGAFAGKMEKAVLLSEKAEGKIGPGLKAAESQVERERRELAGLLKLENYLCLVEKERNPTDFLKEARRQFEGACAALDLGDADSAEVFLDEVDTLVKQALHLVSESKRSLAEYPTASEELWTRRGGLEDLVKAAKEQIEAMRARYAGSALLVDPDQEDCGSFDDSPVELDRFLVGIVKCLDQAKTGQAEGRLLESWDLIESGRALAEAGEDLCEEVRKRQDELQKLEEENRVALQARGRDLDDLATMVDDCRVMNRSLRAYEKIRGLFRKGQAMVEATSGKLDPYAGEKLLSELSIRMEAVREGIADDLEEYEATVALFETVKTALQGGTSLCDEAKSDRIADSQETVEAMRKIESRERELDEASRSLKADHGDWREVHEHLRSIHLGVSEAVGSLGREMKDGRNTVRIIESAGAAVRQASGWTGSFNVRINGRPGGDALDRANSELLNGRYQAAMEWAGKAAAAARSAIASAEAEESARAHAEERRRARRAREARRSRMNSSGFGISSGSSLGRGSSSSFGGGSSRSGGGSFGGSSSVGRSSFSSGSGVGKSSW